MDSHLLCFFFTLSVYNIKVILIFHEAVVFSALIWTEGNWFMLIKIIPVDVKMLMRTHFVICLYLTLMSVSE